MTSQTRITIKGLKVAQFASEETLCFQAQVLFDGKAFAVAHNDGHGGMTCVDVLTQPTTAKGQADRALYTEAEAFAKSLPPTVTEWGQIESTLDMVVDDLASEMNDAKRVATAYRRQIKRNTLVAEGGKVWVYKVPYSPEAASKILAKRPGAFILNTMAEAQALEVFGAAT